MSKVKITQVKSNIRTLPKQRATLVALGLRGIRKTVELEKTAQVDGMIRVVAHLVSVKEA
jgi:large subunit ribosomal protein L30